jgi:nucleotide-binding universal stress UspA family protein
LLLVKTPTFAGYRTILIAADPPRTHDESGRLDDVVLEAGRGFARLFGSTVVEGGAAEAAIDLVAARRADLVVVGAPRTPGAVTEAVGRTAEMVAAGVSCDVLVVPAAPSEIG